MSVEGLQTILNKAPVVGTQAAEVVCQNPQLVEDTYLHHVRSYIPLGRVATGSDDAMTVVEFERRLIDLVKRGQAPTGYVTADYGYGKTSTCLYLWDRCRKANLIAVPPFQMVQLTDLLHVTHAWARYEIGRRAPDLVTRADEIHRRYLLQSIEDMAGGDRAKAEVLRGLQEHGQLLLEVKAARYVQFFEELTRLAVEAGFAGMVVLPDEIQQFVHSESARGTDYPLSQLFDVVQGLVTRRNSLPFGLVFSIPRVTLTLLNDRRGDLVQRLKANGLSLDLLTVYGPTFAADLWEHLTRTFESTAEAPQVVTPEALEALGQIAARDDLANGPRTVVNVFSLMVGRYLDHRDAAPFTPIDLIDDFLSGAVAFDGASTLQTVVNRCLALPLVTANPERGRAVRLVAAFPTTGCTNTVLDQYHLRAAADELVAGGQGDIVLYVGGGLDRAGKQLPIGMTLVGLEPHSTGPTDWLTTTLRDFWRVYYEGDAHTMGRALAGFQSLLREQLFTSPQFSLQQQMDARLTQNAGLVLEGSFAATQRQYPKRRVHVRLLLDEEPVRDGLEGDFALEFHLLAHLDRPESQRWTEPGTILLDDPRNAVIRLNLSHRTTDGIYTNLKQLQPIINPHRLTPLFMLALYAYLEERRAAGAIPQAEDQLVKNTFQASLLDCARTELFNSDLGASLKRAGVAIVEQVFVTQCQTLYPRYVTFMTTNQWNAALRDYLKALSDKRMPGSAERRGEQPLEISKDALATMLGRTATTLDTFLTTNRSLLKVETDFSARSQGQKGLVRFTLHPLERRFLEALRASTDLTPYSWGRQTKQVRRIGRDALYRLGQEEGYRDDEIKTALTLLAERQIIIVQEQQRAVIEDPRGVLDGDALRSDIEAVRAILAPLLAHYKTDGMLRQHEEQFAKLLQALTSPEKPPEGFLIRMANDLEARKRQITTFITDRATEAYTRLQALAVPASLEPSRLAALQTPLSSRLFGLQLEGVRGILAQEAQRYQQARQELEAQRRDRAEQALVETPSPKDLITLVVGVTTLQQGAEHLTRQRQALDARFAGYERAGDALHTAESIQEQLDGAGEAGAALRGDLDEMVRIINGELSSRKAQALEAASDWALQLRELSRRVRGILVDAEDEFESLQSRYRQSLLSLKLKENQLPARTPFNRMDPQGSYHKLYNDVRGSLEHLAANLPAVLSGLVAVLGMREQQCNGKPAAAVAPMRGRLDGLRAVLVESQHEALALGALAGDIDMVKDYTGEGNGAFDAFLRRFDALLTQVAMVKAGLAQIATELSALTSEAANPPALTQSQAVVLRILEAAPTAAGGIDLGTLRQRADGVSISALLTTLGDLYEMGRVLIEVRLPTVETH